LVPTSTKLTSFLRGQGFTDFRAYLIDASAASICFLTTVTRPQYCPDYHAAGDTLVTVIKEDSTYLLAIRKMPFSADAIEEEAFLNLGHDFVKKIIEGK